VQLTPRTLGRHIPADETLGGFYSAQSWLTLRRFSRVSRLPDEIKLIFVDVRPHRIVTANAHERALVRRSAEQVLRYVPAVINTNKRTIQWYMAVCPYLQLLLSRFG
jgi:hypothetical protein